MKRFPPLIPLLLALLGTACGGSASYTPADFTTEVYTPAYASGFDIRGTERNAATLVTVRTPWQGGSGVEQHLLVLREGIEPPAGFDGQIVKAPVRHVVCMSSSHVAMFDAIGQIRRVCGVSGIDYISNAYVNEHRCCGEVLDVGYDTNLNFELLAAMRPDLMLLYGVTGENTIVTGKLRELGIPYIYIGDYMEESPLGKAEWLVLAAELCDLRAAGADTLQRIARDYQALKAHPAPDAPRPKVMLNTPYRDTWFMPARNSYMVRLLEDAGARYVFEENTATQTLPIDIEQAYYLTSKSDFWLNVSGCNTLDEVRRQNPRLADTPPVREGRVYDNNRRRNAAGGSDFWESGVLRPDRVLADLVHIFHPELSETDELYYYRQLE